MSSSGSDKDYKALIQKLKNEAVDIPQLYLACLTEDFLIEQIVIDRDSQTRSY